MAHVLVRHKVADFAKWKPLYDAHAGARVSSGLKEEKLWRNADNPGEVLILFAASDLAKARVFASSKDLQEVMQKCGVVDKPDIYFLQ